MVISWNSRHENKIEDQLSEKERVSGILVNLITAIKKEVN